MTNILLFHKDMYPLVFLIIYLIFPIETNRLQEQILPDATPPVGKIHPFSKITITDKAILMPFKI